MKRKFKATPTALKHDRYERAAKGQIRTKAYKKGYKDGYEKAKKLRMKTEFRNGYKAGLREVVRLLDSLKDELLENLELSKNQKCNLVKIFEDFYVE